MEFTEFRKDVIHFFWLEGGFGSRDGSPKAEAAAFDADLEIISRYRVCMNFKEVKVPREDILDDRQAAGIKKLPYHCFIVGGGIDSYVRFGDFESVPVRKSAHGHIKKAEDAGCRPELKRKRQWTRAEQSNEEVVNILKMFYFNFDLFAMPGSFENGKHHAPEFQIYPAFDYRQKRSKFFLEEFGDAGNRKDNKSD